MEYRLYLFDGTRHGHARHTRAVPLSCASDREAIRHAEEMRRGQYAELWRGERVIRVFEPD